MEISLDLLKETDVEELFVFECGNREFFEKMVPSRGEAYYHFDTFKIRHQELLSEQKNGFSQFYLMRNGAREIIGRINLIDIDPINDTAEIGFRVGEEHGGKGVGNKALQQLLQMDLPIGTIRGKTTTANQGSQKIMEKSGFEKVSVDAEEFEMNGQEMRFVHYLWKK